MDFSSTIPIWKTPFAMFQAAQSGVGSMTNMFSVTKAFGGGSGSSSSSPSASDGMSDETPDNDFSDDFPEKKGGSLKGEEKKEKEFDPFSLDDVATPGSRDDWAKTPLPPTRKPSLIKNPGKFSELEQDSQSVLTTMDMFNGGRLEYNRQSSNFVIGHSLSMGSTLEPSNYNFMMQYFDKKFVALGRINTEGEFQGVINNPVNSWLTLRMNHQRGPAEQPDSVSIFEADVAGDDTTTCFKLQLHNQMPALIMSYYQAITPALSLGCEGQMNLMMMMSALSGGFRYTRNNCVLTGHLSKQPMGPYGGHINFLRKVDSRPGSQIRYGTQFKVSPDPKTHAYKTDWSVAWDYKLQLSSVKGNIDSNGRVHALLEQRMTPFMSLMLSGVADFWNNKYLFGVGLQVVLQELSEEQQKMMMAEEKRIRELREGKAGAKQGGGDAIANEEPLSAAGKDDDDEFAIPKKEQKSYF